MPRFLVGLLSSLLAVAPEFADAAIYMSQEGVDEGVVFAQSMPEASGYLHGNDSNFGGVWNVASQVLIHPEWALTAGHVGQSFSNITVGFGSNIYTDPGHTATVDAIYTHPSFSNIGQGHDLALLHLSTPVTNVVSAAIIQAPVSLGQQVFNVGHGYTGVSGETLVFDGNERAGTDLVDFINIPGFSNNYFEISMDGNTPNVLLERLGAFSDSGGSLYFLGPDNNFELAGVTSYSTGGGVGSSTGFTTLDHDWIYAIISGGVIPSLSGAEEDGDIVVTMDNLRPGTD